MNILGVLGVAFIVLKLCNVITWSWIRVLSPIWIGIIIDVLLIGIIFNLLILGVLAWIKG